jgi:hypothetical protein
VARRPYRVVFTRPAPGINGPPKPGTIVKADLDAAQEEARAIARSGGTAEVHYVSDSGRREIIATYRPSPPTRRVIDAVIGYGPSVLGGAAVLEWVVERWRRRGR